MSGLRVDHDRCEGSRLCAGTYPALFAMTGHVAVVRDAQAVAALPDPDLDEIIFLCPAAAIRRLESGSER